MAEIEEPSQTREEEPRDIYTVWEQLAPREPSPLITVVGPEYEPESDLEEETEEIEVEDEVEEDSDGVPPTSFGAEMFDIVYDRNIELQDRVEELEEQVAERQIALEQKETVVQDLTARIAELEQKLAQSEYQRGQLVAENENMQDDLSEESAKRARAEDAWMKADRRVDRVEREVRSKKARMDEMDYAFRTAIGRAQDRVYHYPIQFEEYPWYVMDRRTMIHIMDQECDDAVRRGMLL